MCITLRNFILVSPLSLIGDRCTVQTLLIDLTVGSLIDIYGCPSIHPLIHPSIQPSIIHPIIISFLLFPRVTGAIWIVHRWVLEYTMDSSPVHQRVTYNHSSSHVVQPEHPKKVNTQTTRRLSTERPTGLQPVNQWASCCEAHISNLRALDQIHQVF